MSRVRVVEVGPRDGLQNEPTAVATAVKLELIARLAAAGLRWIEPTAFVSPRWVPQMADHAELLAALEQTPGMHYPVLVPNLQGLERALEVGAREIAVFTAASESFTRRNINCGIDESLARFAPVIERAGTLDIPVRGYVSCALGCPYEGAIAPAAVARVAERLAALGCAEISLGDTIGTGTPGQARAMVETVAERVPMARLAAHFHDTYGQALANLHAVIEAGIRTVDASVAGLGGCPYARGASGNVATEEVVYMLHGLGFDTGVDLPALVETARWIGERLGRPPSRLARALAPAD
ncbi:MULTISPECIES: hydroxymethylglutaryl-CoA lyase [Marichromatium]|uniref:hydroxymethylglutaryl-CoA lyase n=1 Tax=Marichromatium gracile TaxID=1048 RepID=A0A4R4A836_MARGR|nr:hydroxymethylglutaryl-CoA lyase [Marichromatium gracile]MBK1709528.1 hydroxymethylglutaryl-CoA lyase [Marichromatium gracile]TCW34659.1 hydroxymethylglutaryl-CoA lyase [Marichromatium gracile]